jgi:hypothetical protein
MKKSTAKRPGTLYSRESKSFLAFAQYFKRQRKKNPEIVGSPAALAALYLDAFLLHTEKVRSDTIIRLGLCKENKFTVWRKQQKRLGNLDWTTTNEGGEHIQYHYAPTDIVGKYIRRVAEEHDLLASKGYVDNAIKEVEEEFDQKIEQLSDKHETLEVRVQVLEQQNKVLTEEMAEIREAIQKGAKRYLQENPPDTEERQKAVMDTFKRTGLFLIESDRKRRISR